MPAAPMAGEAGGGRLSSITRDGAAAGPPVAAASPAPKLRKEDEKTVSEAGDASSTSTAAPGQVATDKLDGRASTHRPHKRLRRRTRHRR